jgi:predicted small metal-binding protein
LTKIIHCAKVVPESGCPHSIRGETEEEVLNNAREHAKEHGIVDVTPELVERLKSFIEDEVPA